MKRPLTQTEKNYTEAVKAEDKAESQMDKFSKLSEICKVDAKEILYREIVNLRERINWYNGKINLYKREESVYKSSQNYQYELDMIQIKVRDFTICLDNLQEFVSIFE